LNRIQNGAYGVAMPGDVQIRQLEYLVALAHERHFGRAAAACHASQPALSTALRKLEAELGVAIVQRGHRFAGFTDEGRRVVGWAHRILAERDALRSDLGRVREGLTATLRIGAIPTTVPIIGLLTDALRAQHPQARVRMETFTSQEIVQRLAEFDLDAGLTYIEGGSPPGTTGMELYREEFVLLTSTEGPVGKRETVTWAEAAGLPLCALATNMRNRRILDDAIATSGTHMEPVVETDSVAALYAHLTSGQLSCIAAHAWLPAHGVPTGMRAIPFAGASPRPPIGIVIADRAVADLDVEGTLEHAAAPWYSAPHVG
jgi:DNA-binding transcriptional LysR family regulator